MKDYIKETYLADSIDVPMEHDAITIQNNTGIPANTVRAVLTLKNDYFKKRVFNQDPMPLDIDREDVLDYVIMNSRSVDADTCRNIFMVESQLHELGNFFKSKRIAYVTELPFDTVDRCLYLKSSYSSMYPAASSDEVEGFILTEYEDMTKELYDMIIDAEKDYYLNDPVVSMFDDESIIEKWTQPMAIDEIQWIANDMRMDTASIKEVLRQADHFRQERDQMDEETDDNVLNYIVQKTTNITSVLAQKILRAEKRYYDDLLSFPEE
ncbi:MAG: hypothetical protein PUB39_04405 [Eubacteriales bacterium]|nr:hypothetical protein [Eubacteriales bacterium]